MHTMKKETTHKLVDAYGVKLCPPDSKPENCQFGLPIFAVDRKSAVNHAVEMLSHLNIKADIALIAYLGTYDIDAGRFAPPAKGKDWKMPLVNALQEVAHEAK